MKETWEKINKRCKKMYNALPLMKFESYGEHFTGWCVVLKNGHEALFVIQDSYSNGLYFVVAEDGAQAIRKVKSEILKGKSWEKLCGEWDEEEKEMIAPKGYKYVKDPKSERMQLLVRPALKDAIRAEAQAQGLSMNDLVNNILEEYLESNSKE